MSLLRSRRSAHADIAVFIADAKVPGGTSGLRSTSDHEPMGIFEEQIDIWSLYSGANCYSNNLLPSLAISLL